MARRAVFYHRLRIICEKMVGPGLFELLPESSLRLLYVYRYPDVKVVVRGTGAMTGKELIEYRQSLVELLSEHYVDTLRGEHISYARFLTDALVLIHYIEYRVGNRIKGFSKLREAFAPYFTDTDWFRHQREKIVQLMSISDLALYDFYRGTVRFSFDRMAIERVGKNNELLVYRLAHTTKLHEIDGKKRHVVRMGMPSSTKVDEFEWIAVRPSQLGILDIEGEVPLPIYAQQHALDRFEERAVMWRGYVQVYLGQLFLNGSPKTIIRKSHILLECCIGPHKIGYFVVSLHEDKWLIRTFLFLTNEGTPEGNKLKQLTKLQIEDKKYLMIDRMDAFLIYDIAGDNALQKLFTKAGCGSLLQYAEVLNKAGGNPLKNPDFIYQYLSKSGF